MFNKRILKNTLVLYARQIFVILVNLYSLRVVLAALGVNDYGVYSVVAGVVTLCAFLPVTLASGTQRFFSFALGEGKDGNEKLTEIFSVNLILYLIVALFALLLLEVVGLAFVNEYLVISLDRVDSAKILFHFTVFSFILSVLTSPFIAIIVAHEDMHVYAYLSILEALFKLGIVYALMYLEGDKLQIYGCLLFIGATINAAMYIFICLKKYPECQLKKIYWNTNLFKQIIGFTGWTLLGAFTSVVRNQAVTVLLNQMHNPVAVAARSISTTVATQVMVFASNFNTSLYPPIIKSYAANEKKEMFSLVFNGSKLSFFLMWIFALPMLMEMETILTFWLKAPPKDTVIFTQLALIEMLIVSFSLALATAARAPGKMMSYELILGAMQVAVFVCSWWVLSVGYPPYSIFIVAIVVNVMMLWVRLFLVSRLIGLQIMNFFGQVILPLIAVITLSTISTLLVDEVMPDGIVYSLSIFFLSVCFSTVSMYYIGLDASWRDKIRTLFVSRVAMLWS